MIIREQQGTDTDELERLMLDARYSSDKARVRARNFANGKSKIMIVGIYEGKLVGFVGFKQRDENIQAKRFVDIENTAHLNWTAVHPDFRHRGFGSALVQACHDFVARNWKEKNGIWLDCRQGVLPFYGFNGYAIAGKYPDEGEDRYVLVKKF